MQKRRSQLITYNVAEGWRIEETLQNGKYVYFVYSTDCGDMKFYLTESNDLPLTEHEIGRVFELFRPAVATLLNAIDECMERVGGQHQSLACS